MFKLSINESNKELKTQNQVPHVTKEGGNAGNSEF